jgi:hypothetical protein
MLADDLNSKHEIGYKHPPKRTQFRPGISGNPSGRPKGSRNVAAVVRRTLEEKGGIIRRACAPDGAAFLPAIGLFQPPTLTFWQGLAHLRPARKALATALLLGPFIY